MTYEELPASAVGMGKKWDSVVVVPVWFHVVHDNGIGDVSDADINRQIRIMNLATRVSTAAMTRASDSSLSASTRTNNAEWFYAGPTPRASGR